MVVLVPDMVGSVPLRGKLDLDSLSCRASLESQKSLLHAGGPLESYKVMSQKAGSNWGGVRGDGYCGKCKTLNE